MVGFDPHLFPHWCTLKITEQLISYYNMAGCCKTLKNWNLSCFVIGWDFPQGKQRAVQTCFCKTAINVYNQIMNQSLLVTSMCKSVKKCEFVFHGKRWNIIRR